MGDILPVPAAPGPSPLGLSALGVRDRVPAHRRRTAADRADGIVDRCPAGQLRARRSPRQPKTPRKHRWQSSHEGLEVHAGVVADAGAVTGVRWHAAASSWRGDGCGGTHPERQGGRDWTGRRAATVPSAGRARCGKDRFASDLLVKAAQGSYDLSGLHAQRMNLVEQGPENLRDSTDHQDHEGHPSHGLHAHHPFRHRSTMSQPAPIAGRAFLATGLVRGKGFKSRDLPPITGATRQAHEHFTSKPPKTSEPETEHDH